MPALWDEVPHCDRAQPNLGCIRQLFVPLEEAAVPFDVARVAAAVVPNRAYVGKEWLLTAHHVLEADSPFPYGCFFDAFRYASDLVPFNGPGCGELLAAGGHPLAPDCLAQQILMGYCVDLVPSSESFDLVVTRSSVPSAQFLSPRGTPPKVGDEVFLVGSPAFSWLPSDVQVQLEQLHPLVSRGHVLKVEGRGIVADVPAFRGSSGGPLLNRAGEVLGVAYTLVGHQRAAMTPTAPEHLDHHLVSTALEQPLIDILLKLGTEAADGTSSP